MNIYPTLTELFSSDLAENSIMQQIALAVSAISTTALIGAVGVLTVTGAQFGQQQLAQMESMTASSALNRDFRLADGIEVEDSMGFTLIDPDYRAADTDPSEPRVCRHSTWALTPSGSETAPLQLVNTVEIFPDCGGGWLPTSTSTRTVISAVEQGARFSYENVAGRPITFTDGSPRIPSSFQRWLILTIGGYDNWWTDAEVIDPTVRVVRMSMTTPSPVTGGIDASVVGAVPVALDMLEHPTGNDDVAYNEGIEVYIEP
jgi:hypothetical protein